MEETRMACAIMVESEPAERVQRYPLPVSRQKSATTRFVKRITDDAGTVHEFEFDFTPEPTWEEFCSHILHTCQTCAWKELRGTSYCTTPTPTHDTPCDAWELADTAYTLANIGYYKALHEKHYGKT